jgi:hypothetical protein
MAQTNYIVDYIAGMRAEAGKSYTAASILALYPSATVVEVRSKETIVSINGTIAVKFSYGEQTTITTGKTWVFITDCDLAIGKLVSLV